MGKYISRVPENVKGYVVLSNITLHMWHATTNQHDKYKKSKTKRCVETLIKSCLLGIYLSCCIFGIWLSSRSCFYFHSLTHILSITKKTKSDNNYNRTLDWPRSPATLLESFKTKVQKSTNTRTFCCWITSQLQDLSGVLASPVALSMSMHVLIWESNHIRACANLPYEA